MNDELYLQLIVMNTYLNAIVTKLCGAGVNKECLKTANDLAETRLKALVDADKEQSE